jgi:SHS2 domain-containing protein
MMKVPNQGYKELEHTADWALEVWAPDLPGLFIQAAKGMYALSQVEHVPEEQVEQTLSLEAIDAEVLLVTFLDELLFLAEHESLGFKEFDLEIDANFNLQAKLCGAKIFSLNKEIKAVTYHNLSIQKNPDGFRVVIVFDV